MPNVVSRIAALFAPPQLRGAPDRREIRVAQEGSPYYQILASAIAAGGDEYLNMENQLPEAIKYFPLDWLRIINNDTVDITVTINGSEVVHVPAGVIETLDAEMAIRTVNLHNDHGSTAVTVGKLRLSLQRKPVSPEAQFRQVLG